MPVIMNAMPPTFPPSGHGPDVPPALLAGALAGSGQADDEQALIGAMGTKWAAVHDAAGVVAMLAGLAPAPMAAEIRNFPALICNVGGWRRNLAEQGIADLIAVLKPGIAALLAVQARGANPAAAAQALWQEFAAARDALLALAPPPGAIPPVLRHFP